MDYRFYNEDCVAGARKHIPDGAVDLMICDPPYGIAGDTLHKHYNRDEKHVLDGYVEVAAEKYAEFSAQWIQQAARVLKPGGSIYVVSGYTNLIHVLSALRETDLREVNHIIWKYNFGVYTKTKYISSHYHILFYQKPGGDRAFNTFCRFADSEKADNGGSLNYQDREDVWVINREYNPGEAKNKNQLPTRLLMKMIQYSSRENDLVCDFFLGGFSTAKVAKGLNRRATGFELSKTAFDHQVKAVADLREGYLLDEIRKPPKNSYFNRGKTVDDDERRSIVAEYRQLRDGGKAKKESIDILSGKFGRGYWSLLNIIDGTTKFALTPGPSPGGRGAAKPAAPSVS